MAKQAPKKT